LVRVALVRILCELSGENVPLAEAEFEALLASRGTRVPQEDGTPLPLVRAAVVLDDVAARELGHRMALLRQLLVRIPPTSRTLEAGDFDPQRNASLTFRWLRAPSPEEASLLPRLVNEFRAAGGRVQLSGADREIRLWVEAGSLAAAERVAVADRAGFAARRMPRLPFQKPVSLPPKRARALVNLGRAQPGAHVVDPFVGTGALLLEAALLGARVVGVDRSPEMVRGAARNFAHLGQAAEELLAEDAASAAERYAPESFDALVTDPPYGRASGTGGEPADSLLVRALAAWSPRLAPNARIALALPSDRPDPLAPPWERRSSVPDYVHRSLVREFRVYARKGATA
jgi:putative methyltransferase (TIGR01177 family)